MSTRFFAELPQDEYGNTAHGPAVIEAEVIHRDRGPLSGYGTLRVVAPADHARRWPEHYLDVWRWCEVEGPARELTRDEWAALVAGRPRVLS